MRKPNNNPTPVWARHTSFRFSVGLVLSLTLVLTAFEWNFRTPHLSDPITAEQLSPLVTPEMKVLVLPPPPKPQVPVDILEVPESDPLPTEKKVVDPPVDFINASPTPSIEDLLGDVKPVEKAAEVEEYDLVPAVPEEGMESFYQYLYEHIEYPEHLKGRNISGRVEVAFEVDENGKITAIKILKGFDKKLEKEIIRILKEAPAWIPAQKGYKKVRTYHTIPFSFNLQ